MNTYRVAKVYPKSRRLVFDKSSYVWRAGVLRDMGRTEEEAIARFIARQEAVATAALERAKDCVEDIKKAKEIALERKLRDLAKEVADKYRGLGQFKIDLPQDFMDEEVVRECPLTGLSCLPQCDPELCLRAKGSR